MEDRGAPPLRAALVPPARSEQRNGTVRRQAVVRQPERHHREHHEKARRPQRERDPGISRGSRQARRRASVPTMRAAGTIQGKAPIPAAARNSPVASGTSSSGKSRVSVALRR